MWTWCLYVLTCHWGCSVCHWCSHYSISKIIYSLHAAEYYANTLICLFASYLQPHCSCCLEWCIADASRRKLKSPCVLRWLRLIHWRKSSLSIWMKKETRGFPLLLKSSWPTYEAATVILEVGFCSSGNASFTWRLTEVCTNLMSGHFKQTLCKE